MKSHILSLCLAFTALTAVFSCSKDDNNFVATMQNIAGLYKPTANTYQVGTADVVDAYATFPDCFKDNTLQINAEGTYHFLDNANTCSPTVERTGVWSLPNPNLMIVDGVVYDITFDGKTMIQHISDTTNGVITKRTITLVKQ